MRAKIVFLVVFMLSFVIVHDTVLTLIDQNQKVVASISSDCDTVSKTSMNTHQMHSMFHFVALVTTVSASMDMVLNRQSIAYYTPEYILPYKKSIIKPPIA